MIDLYPIRHCIEGYSELSLTKGSIYLRLLNSSKTLGYRPNIYHTVPTLKATDLARQSIACVCRPRVQFELEL